MKVYRHNNKLVIYLPFEVTEALKLTEGDEVDFFRYNVSSFLFAKKSDIVSILSRRSEAPASRFSAEEIGVLKKLDTLRYVDRTEENVKKKLSDAEMPALRSLLGKRAVDLFQSKKSGGVPVYSISKDVYDNFLMRKKPQRAGAQYDVQRLAQQPSVQHVTFQAIKESIPGNENVKKLEEQGFIVLPTEAEASSLSLALEESIRQGMVLGTRAFNKKFYILLRAFFDQYSRKVVESLRSGKDKTSDIAASIGISEDAARAILYLLAENGDVSERRRDQFELA